MHVVNHGMFGGVLGVNLYPELHLRLKAYRNGKTIFLARGVNIFGQKGQAGRTGGPQKEKGKEQAEGCGFDFCQNFYLSAFLLNASRKLFEIGQTGL